MPLHSCPHTFQELATTVLPRQMERMRVSMQKPQRLADFGVEGVGVAKLLARNGLARDFAGCYVLVDGGEPIYVGISRGVFGRLRQHVYGKTHFDASLAYRIAFARHPHRTIEKLTRSKAMEDRVFGTSFVEAREYLRSLQVGFVDVPNALELYVFEAYCAMELDTHQWNSFETH